MLRDVKAAIGKAKDSFWKQKDLFGNNFKTEMKKRLLQAYVWSVMRYSSEMFSLTKSVQKRIKAFEIWSHRCMIKISYQDRITNKDVLKRVGMKNIVLLTSIITRQCRFSGHVERESVGSFLLDCQLCKMKKFVEVGKECNAQRL